MAVCFLFPAAAKAQTDPERKVLVLHSYRPAYWWTREIMEGIESAFGQYEGIIHIDAEYMDVSNSKDEEHFQNLLSLYKHKAARRQYDIIITSDNIALEFLLQYCDELYPGVPIVFCGINNFQESMLGGHDSVTGVTEEKVLESMVEAALKLHPSAKQVVFVNSSKKVEQTEQRLANLARQLNRPVKFTSIFLSKPSLEELIKQIEHLGSESIVVFTSSFGVGLDRLGGIEDILKQRCDVPIYVLTPRWFKKAPVVGGKFNSGLGQGRAAAEMAMRILNGESPQNIPILQGAGARHIFDYTQLKRFGISLSDLPKDSVILNEPESFYYLYKKRIWVTIVIIATLAVAITILSTNIILRKKAQRALLSHQARLKSLASQLSLTEERQRRRIATVLHDQISQSVVISKIKLETLRESAPDQSLAEGLNEVCSLLGQTIQNSRSLTFELSYPLLYELGFEAAVAEWLAEQVQEKHNIATEFESDRQPKPLDDDIRALLFRSVRELLINVVKHANARKVRVCSRRVDDQIQISVGDDGVGFDVKEIALKAAKPGGFVLFGVRERLEQLGGRLEIESEPGRGTKVMIMAPLKQEQIDSGVRV